MLNSNQGLIYTSEHKEKCKNSINGLIFSFKYLFYQHLSLQPHTMSIFIGAFLVLIPRVAEVPVTGSAK